MSNEIDLGRKGEEIALQWLLTHGMRLRDRNWRAGHKEVDLIVEDDDSIRFVEVKTLRAPAQIRPYEQVGPKKQRKLAAAANYYVLRYKICKEVKFDIVSIIINGDKYDLEYIPEAFFSIY